MIQVGDDEEEEGEEVEEWGEDDDDTDASDDVECALFEMLEDINEARSWASYGSVQYDLPLPKLHLSQCGLVELPLSSMDALRIKQHASKFGLGSGSRVDENDQTCILDPSQFKLQNPKWHNIAQGLGMEAARPFDVGPAGVQLRGLVLSSPSRSLKLWQNLNPHPAACGSFMIVLPSLHQGGDIKLTYGNEARQFPTDTTSEFGYSFVAWFSDVRLELNPILSGYRLHLIYDLYSPMTQLGAHPSASSLSDEAARYRSRLEQWSRLREYDGNPDPLVTFILKDEERDYKNGRMCYGRLNENHMFKANFLQQQCVENKVCFWLARMSSCVDRSRYGASESILMLDEVSELDRTEVMLASMPVNERDVVEIKSFKRREANDSDHAERDSDPDNSIYHFKDWVFLLLPESQRLQFLADNMGAEELRWWIAHRADLLYLSGPTIHGPNLATSKEEQRKELAIVCHRVISMERSRRRDEDDMWLFEPHTPDFSLALEHLAKATLVARQVHLFGQVVTECPGKLSQETWRDIGMEFNDNDVLHGGYKDRLTVALSKIHTLAGRYTVLERILSGYLRRTVKPDDDPLRLWARENIVISLSSLSYCREEDGRTLAAIEEKFGGDILMGRRVPDK